MNRPHRTNLLFLFALAAALIGFAARWFLASASEFSRYDDEGFVMLMLRHYMSGDVLYSGFYAQYGPFAYQVLATVHGVLGLDPSNDSARISSLLVYAATFAVWAGIAASTLRNPAIAVLFLLALGQQLMTTSVEPGHPQDVGALLVALCAGASLLQRTAESARTRRAAAVAVGACVAVLMLTKLNVGIFVALALLFLAPLDRYGWRVARFALAVLPLALMQQRLDHEWVRNFCLIETAGLLVFLVATVAPAGATERSVAPWLRGALAATVLVLGIEVIHGASAYALASGIVLQHLHFPAQAMQPGFVPPETLYAAVASAVLFSVVYLTRQQPWSARISEACKLGVSAAGMAYAIGFGVDYLLAFGITFVWLLVSARLERGWMLFMAALTLLLPLQAYPVAGTQYYLGAIPLTFLCALAFDDVVSNAQSTVIKSALVLLAGIGLVYQFAALRKSAAEYAELTPLALPGATLVRLPADEVTEYRELTQRMKQFDSFVSQPGLLSLYLWTETNPPTKWNAGAWVRLIGTERQNEIVAALQRTQRPGAAVHPTRAAFWTEQRQELSSPLAGYLESACATTETIGEWQVRTCAGSRISAAGDVAPARSN